MVTKKILTVVGPEVVLLVQTVLMVFKMVMRKVLTVVVFIALHAVSSRVK